MIIKDLNRCQTGNSIIVKYWKMFCSCSYPGRGPGPGPGFNCMKSNNNNNSSQQVVVHRPHKRQRRRRILKIRNLDSFKINKNNVLFWLYWLGIMWLSCTMTIVGCKKEQQKINNDDDESLLLVSNCDFNKLERIAAAVNDRNYNNNNNNDYQPNCTVIQKNYYEYRKNNNNNENAKQLKKMITKRDKDEEQSKTINEIRLTAIKHQILSKLGLKSKPNVTHTLSKEVILETLRRTEEAQAMNYNNNNNNYHQNPQDFYLLSGDYGNTVTTNYKITNQFYQNQQFNLYNNHRQQHQQQTQEQVPFDVAYNDEEQDNNVADDFYGRTREIIAFASKGKSLSFLIFFSYFSKKKF